jgi:hypothetical protein
LYDCYIRGKTILPRSMMRFDSPADNCPVYVL